MNYLKQFLDWLYQKTVIHNRVKLPQFSEREIFWCAIGQNVGDEECGKGELFTRPVLVIKKFNSNLFWGVPLTTKVKENKYYIKITFNNKTQCAMITHLRLYDSKRLYNRLGRLDTKDFAVVVEQIKLNLPLAGK